MPPWKGHAFVGTCNNYTEESERKLREAPWIESMIYGREVAPTTGTRHLQFFLWSVEPIQLTQAKRKLPGFVVFTPGKKKPPTYWYDDDGYHKDPEGNPLGYCKKDGDWEERGIQATDADFMAQVPTGQGTRSDLLLAKDEIDKGTPVENLLGKDDHFQVMARHEPYLNKYAAFLKRRRGYEKPDVFVYYGDAGAGKTRAVRAAIGNKDYYRHSSSMEKWFDGYAGHDIVFFDEYRSYFTYGTLLELLDGYDGYQVQVKQSRVFWSPKTIYITAPRHPRDWYPNLMDKEGSIDQLLRRITKITHLALP